MDQNAASSSAAQPSQPQQTQQQQQRPTAVHPAAMLQQAAAIPMLQIPLQVMQDPAILSQLTGIDTKLLATNPTMLVAAQHLFAQRVFQQQLANAALGMRPPFAPGMMASMQPPVPAKASKKTPGSGGKRPVASPIGTLPLQEADAFVTKEDPGGKVVWAKVANYPWWPAKILDPAKDRSFPAESEPPRPTAIPVRFFGTHDFGWMGSKRALTDWEEGREQCMKECSQDSFKEAVAEAEKYLKEKVLPDSFYIASSQGSGRKGRAGVARKRSTTGTGGGSAKKQIIREGGENRIVLMQERKKQRLLDLGLVPPANSPYGAVDGTVAPNPELLKLSAAWPQEDVALEMVKCRAEVPFRAMLLSRGPGQLVPPMNGAEAK